MNLLKMYKKIMVTAIIAAYPIHASAAVGKIEFANGVVNAVGVDGRSRELIKGANVENGDTLRTLNGRAQVKFSDGGYISLQPYTDFKVEDYEFNGSEDGKEKSVFTLLKGGLRAVTGSIGHKNKDNFKLNTSTATIGIRGTEFLVTLNGETLRVFCGNGGVFVKNEAGTLVLYQGQSGVVGGPNSAPQQSTDVPTVTSASPTGNTNSSSESNGSSDTQAVIANGNIRLNADSLCQTDSDGCIVNEISNDPSVLLQGGLGNIPLLNQLGAFAEYSGTSSVTIAGSTAPVDTFLGINFLDYKTEFDLSGTFNNAGAYANQVLFGFVDGSLNSSTGALTFDSQTSGGSIGSVPITVSASGSLSASNLSVALILYSISDGSNFGSSSTSLNGQILTDDDLIPPTSPSDELARLNALLIGPLSNIPELNAAGAFAEYSGTQTISMLYNTGSISGDAFLNVGLDFTDYSVDANLFVQIAGSPGIDLGGEQLIGVITSNVGALNPATGAFTAGAGTVRLNVDPMTGTSLVTGISGLPTNTGGFSITSGQLSSTNISQATVTTSFNIPNESNNINSYSLQGAVTQAATIP